MWLTLLANKIVDFYQHTGLGHAARLNGLRRADAIRLQHSLRKGMPATWDPMVVSSSPQDASEVSLDVAIEKRNDKSRSRLFIVPTELVSEAAASLADTDVIEVTKFLRSIYLSLLKSRIDEDDRDLVKQAAKAATLSEKVQYLSALPDSPSREQLGMLFWMVGLVPDHAPTQDRVVRNIASVEILEDMQSYASVRQRVEATALNEPSKRRALLQLLSTDGAQRNDWLKRIAEDASLALTFDEWQFDDVAQVEITGIEIHSFVDTKKDRAYTWSGLSLDDGTLKVSTRGVKPKVTVHWNAVPVTPTGSPIYEITVETADAQSVSLLTDQQKHRPKPTQSWSFRPADIEEVEGGSVRARVTLRCYPEEGRPAIVAESDEFLIVHEELTDVPRGMSYPVVRSIPDALLERALDTEELPTITARTVESGSAVKLQLNERSRRRIVLNPLLYAAERRFLDAPEAGTLSFAISAEARGGDKEFSWLSKRDPKDLCGNEFAKSRREIFRPIADGQEGLGVVESAQLSSLSEEILEYVRSYANRLDGLLAQKSGEARNRAISELLLIDTIALAEHGTTGSAGRPKALLVSPLHPLRLAWHLGHETLLQHWISRAQDEGARLPVLSLARDLNAANTPAFIAADGSLFYHFDSPLFHWALYLDADDGDPLKTAAIVRWSMGFSGGEALSVGQEQTAEILGRRLHTYARLHPYVRTLQVNAVNAGDGRLLLRALGKMEAALDEPQGSPDYDYELRLYGPSPVHQIGSFLDSCVDLKRHGERLPKELERLFRRGETFLRPHLFWAKRELEEIEGPDPTIQDAHVGFVTEYFRPQRAIVDDARLDSAEPIYTYGLQTDLTRDFVRTDDGFAWVQSTRIPESARATHPADKRLTRDLLRCHRAILKACAHLCGGNDESWPATRVPVQAEQFTLFSRLHEASDWVVTVDRNLGVELFDTPAEADEKPGAKDLKENAKRYLIDFAPVQVGSAGQQLMISTSWVDEVSGLLRDTLQEMSISPTDFACEEVLRLLKSISGRLVMRVARYPEVAKEAVSLAVVHQILRGKGELENAFLVPIDEHIGMFRGQRQDEEAEQISRRPDLLLVSPQRDRKGPLSIDVIEVKYRKHKYLAYETSLWADMRESVDSGVELLAQNYFPKEARKALDLPLSRRKLAGVFSFYASRAIRHGVLDMDAGRKVLDWMKNLDREDLEVKYSPRGFIYCPDLAFAEEPQKTEGLSLVIIGRGALPRYTSFHALVESETEVVAEPAQTLAAIATASTPAGPNVGTVSDVLIKAPIAATPAVDLQAPDEVPPPTPALAPSAAVARPAIVPPDSREMKILLGYDREKSVYFRPSLKGNPHALIVGIPGMGKTTAIVNIGRALSACGIYPFVVDFHGDLATKLAVDSADSSVMVVDAAKGLPFNPLQLDHARAAEDQGWIMQCFEIAEIFGNIYPSFGQLQIGTIRDTLRETYEEAGFKSGARDRTPSFERFWERLQAKAAVTKDVRKITTRLESIFHLNLFQSTPEHSFSLPDLLGHTTILDLHRLALEENQRVAASFFLQRIYRDMFNHDQMKVLRTAVVFDEAHRVARLKLIPKMMQECRKYGILFIVSSQRVDDFDQGVLDSAGNQLCMRVNYPDAKRLAPYLGAKGGGEEITILQNLKPHRALFRSDDYRPYTKLALLPPDHQGADGE